MFYPLCSTHLKSTRLTGNIWLDPAFRAWNIVGELASIECPLLAVQADDDHYGTMAQIDAIGQAVHHAQLCKLPHGGHSPHREASDVLNEAIAQFVDAPLARRNRASSFPTPLECGVHTPTNKILSAWKLPRKRIPMKVKRLRCC